MFLFFRRRPRAGAVARDVERMLRHYGAEAYRIAGEMSWRGDAGLMTAPAEGHWHRVHVEIGRRIGQSAPQWTPDRGPDLGGIDVPDVRQNSARLPEPQIRLRAAAPAE